MCRRFGIRWKKGCRRVALIALLGSGPAVAGEVTVLDVQVKASASDQYSFAVKVQHEDTGWHHYVDRWDVMSPQGTLLGTRVLHHPHVNEQPFVRSLNNVVVPPELKYVLVRAHDSVHGYGSKDFRVDLPGR